MHIHEGSEFRIHFCLLVAHKRFSTGLLLAYERDNV